MKNPEVEREGNRENKENNDKEKISPKEIKNRKREDMKRDKVLASRDRDPKPLGKSYRDREDKKHDRDNKPSNKKYEDKKPYRRDDYAKEDRREAKSSREDSGSYQKEKSVEERKGKSYEKMRQEKRRAAEAKKDEDLPKEKPRDLNPDKSETKNDQVVLPIKIVCNDESKDCEVLLSNELPDDSQDDKEASPKLEEVIKNDSAKKSVSKAYKMKVVKRRSSLESGGGGGGGDGAFLRRHKSLDGGEEDNLQKNDSDYKGKSKKDPRLERRIRNKVIIKLLSFLYSLFF